MEMENNYLEAWVLAERENLLMRFKNGLEGIGLEACLASLLNIQRSVTMYQLCYCETNKKLKIVLALPL